MLLAATATQLLEHWYFNYDLKHSLSLSKTPNRSFNPNGNANLSTSHYQMGHLSV
jgi:hypothetical protein